MGVWAILVQSVSSWLGCTLRYLSMQSSALKGVCSSFSHDMCVADLYANAMFDYIH